MPTVTTSLPKPIAATENTAAREALNAIQQIERQAREKKLAQVAKLQEAKQAIQHRMAEFQHQIDQLETALSAITGTSQTPGSRRNLSEARERVYAWLESHRGEKFQAGQIFQQFPELEGVVMSTFLKPLIESGKIRTDTSNGIRRSKYFVA